MSAADRRTREATPKERLALSRHAALKQRPQADVLVLPERAIRLEGSGAEILLLCNGERSSNDITQILCERYPESEGIGAEVDRFIAEMVELGGLICGTRDAGTKPA